MKRLINKIGNFFVEMLSTKDNVSSKRFAGLSGLFVIFILSFISTAANGGITPDYILINLSVLVGGSLGISAIEKIYQIRYTNKYKTSEPINDDNDDIDLNPDITIPSEDDDNEPIDDLDVCTCKKHNCSCNKK